MSQQPPVERTPKNKETNEQKALPVLPEGTPYCSPTRFCR